MHGRLEEVIKCSREWQESGWEGVCGQSAKVLECVTFKEWRKW